MKEKLFILIIFGIAFAFVEAAVVSYLRDMSGYNNGYSLDNYKTLFDLGVIAFIQAEVPILNNAVITITEIQREVATIIVLFAVSFLSRTKWRQRIGAFLIVFGVWDIFYYVFLKYLTGWPKSFFDIDIYFMIPVLWIGPVFTPLTASSILIIIGVILYLRR
ncbi:MAG: hypothetical protein HY424_00610 [Candidatus Levybacteria bacterium]|nr:hypothetical protein [Candidatus Levybacteria bacterium]